VLHWRCIFQGRDFKTSEEKNAAHGSGGVPRFDIDVGFPS
jgi:hypothetical protein